VALSGPSQILRARVLRPAARRDKLWQRLRCWQLGVTFRRQVPLHCFIVDFFASEGRLGGYHAERAAADARPDPVVHHTRLQSDLQ
jgi:very-short-patch-repair endonuclease